MKYFVNMKVVKYLVLEIDAENIKEAKDKALYDTEHKYLVSKVLDIRNCDEREMHVEKNIEM